MCLFLVAKARRLSPETLNVVSCRGGGKCLNGSESFDITTSDLPNEAFKQIDQSFRIKYLNSNVVVNFGIMPS
jgi:hypothetical protein